MSIKLLAHSGRTDSNQCHKNSKNDTFHCHKPEVLTGTKYNVIDETPYPWKEEKLDFPV